MLQLRQISHNFGAFAALQNVDFAANGGEIVGLLGENGAGKSTLLNIVGGALSPSSGELIYDGKARHFASARDAASCGIGVVHQHARLVETFSAGENLALHAQNNGVRVDRKKWNAQVETWAQSLGWQISSGVAVENLSVGERQRIEILKALFAHNSAGKAEIEYSNSSQNDQIGARLLLLDEPTSNLTPDETVELFAVLRRLKNEGRAVVFVSHKLNEVMNLCDRVVVLRRGQVVGERQITQTNVDDLATLMIGETASLSPVAAIFNAQTPNAPPHDSYAKTPFLQSFQTPVAAASSTRSAENDAPIRLQIDNLSGGVLRNFSLQIRAGEIVGIAGVDGNGQSELVELLSGLRAPKSGTFCCENAVGASENEIRPRKSAKAEKAKAENANANSKSDAAFADATNTQIDGAKVGKASPQMGDDSARIASAQNAESFNLEAPTPSRFGANASCEIAVIPPDRQRVGLIGDFDLAENLALHPLLRARCRKTFGFDWKRARQTTRELMTRYDVRAPQTLERTRAMDLSGGNQQKLVIARALEFPHGAVVAADPTRGLDIGASRFVHAQLRKAARNGAAVLLISTDLDEIFALSDRVGVLYEGRLSPDVLLSRDPNGDFDRERIGALMGGKSVGANLE